MRVEEKKEDEQPTELEIAKAQKDISDRVKASVEKNQREFYLREQ